MCLGLAGFSLKLYLGIELLFYKRKKLFHSLNKPDVILSRKLCITSDESSLLETTSPIRR